MEAYGSNAWSRAQVLGRSPQREGAVAAHDSIEWRRIDRTAQATTSDC
jgi:hypothetical protein